MYMNTRILSGFIVLAVVLATLPARAEKLSLDEISRGAFAAKGVHGVRPLMDGERYAQMDGKQITAQSCSGNNVNTTTGECIAYNSSASILAN
jgi:hypothetical protein